MYSDSSPIVSSTPNVHAKMLGRCFCSTWCQRVSLMNRSLLKHMIMTITMHRMAKIRFIHHSLSRLIWICPVSETAWSCSIHPAASAMANRAMAPVSTSLCHVRLRRSVSCPSFSAIASSFPPAVASFFSAMASSFPPAVGPICCVVILICGAVILSGSEESVTSLHGSDPDPSLRSG